MDTLGAKDFHSDNFRWINCFQYNECIVSFCRLLREEEGSVLVTANFANASRSAFRVGVPYEGKYRLIFHTENISYGGQRKEEELLIYSEEIEWDGYPYSIEVEMDPLSLAVFVFLPYTEEELFEIANSYLKPMRDKYNYYMEHFDEVMKMLKKGEEKAKKIAQETIERVKKAVGVI
jgi:hypothetical protein